MFLGRIDEAKAIYLANKGKPINPDDTLWEEAVADDFEAFRKAGLDHPAMAAILSSLGIPNVQAREQLTALRDSVGKLDEAFKYQDAVVAADR